MTQGLTGERIETIDIEYPGADAPAWPGAEWPDVGAPLRLAVRPGPDGPRVYVRLERPDSPGPDGVPLVGAAIDSVVIVGSVSARLFVLAGRRIEAHCREGGASLFEGWQAPADPIGEPSGAEAVKPAGGEAS